MDNEAPEFDDEYDILCSDVGTSEDFLQLFNTAICFILGAIE
jgi:hypothetical protein